MNDIGFIDFLMIMVIVCLPLALIFVRIARLNNIDEREDSRRDQDTRKNWQELIKKRVG